MKILYIHQYFRTPEEGGAIRSYYLAKGMVENGLEVEMITAHNKSDGATKHIDNIKVHYLPIYYDNNQNSWGRTVSFLKFMRAALKKAAEIKNVDLVYATSTPLTIGWIALRIKKRLGLPYIFEVRDLWPEAPFQLGFIKNPILKSFLKRLEHKVYKEARSIIALSPGIQSLILEENPNLKVEVVPNMSDIDFFGKESKKGELEELFGVKDRFVISYFGAIGLSNHLEYMLAVANACKKAHLPVEFLIIGQGSQVEHLKYLARQFELTNLRFLEFQNKYNLKRILNVTDAAYVSFASKPILETNSPNKFFDALASGKLIITNTKGWVKEICEKYKCGFYYDPHHPEQFVEKLKGFIDNQNQLNTYQNSARQVGENYFSRSEQVRKLLLMLENKN